MPGHVLIGLAPTPQTAGKKPPKPDTGRTRKYRLQNLTPDDTGRHNQEKGSKHRLLVGPAKLELGDTRQHQPNPAGKTARKADTKRHQTNPADNTRLWFGKIGGVAERTVGWRKGLRRIHMCYDRLGVI